MAVYWFIYSISTFILFISDKFDKASKMSLFFVYFLFIAFIIGFRYEIGGDWFAYLRHYEETIHVDFLSALKMGDPAYMGLNWLSSHLNLGIIGVNVVCGVVVAFALIYFVMSQPMPWLGLIVATPYYLIIVSMGYSRQSVAISFVMLAYTQWNKEPWKYIVLVLLGALFHKTAIFAIIFAPMILNGSLRVKLSTILLMFPLMYFIFLADNIDAMVHGYARGGNANMKSEGGAMRVAMNLIPSIIFLIFYKTFMQFKDYKLWFYISIANIISMIFVSTYSTAVDRIALYLLPIQIAFYARVPMLIENSILRTLFVFAIIIIYGLMMFVWFNYSVKAEFWLPYRFEF
ncbi:MAG: hypothetical protein KN64_00225 [Sulfurovum sp. AS07-7]|nr:MAG: hypothetical protein KN64_04875 [Sulfurovum sp. AS07-7]KIM05976.1 MAG: hypothetical protein KN64_00225 [Sulfurovum sp. AS07-7]